MKSTYQALNHFFRFSKSHLLPAVTSDCLTLLKQKGFQPLFWCLLSFFFIQTLPRLIAVTYYTIKSLFDPYWAGFRFQIALSFLTGTNEVQFDQLQPLITFISLGCTILLFCFFGNANFNAFRSMIYENKTTTAKSYFAGGFYRLPSFAFQYLMRVQVPLMILTGGLNLLKYLPFTNLSALIPLILNTSQIGLLFLMIASFIQRETPELLVDEFQIWGPYALMAFVFTSLFNSPLTFILSQLILIPYSLLALDRSSQIVQSVVYTEAITVSDY